MFLTELYKVAGLIVILDSANVKRIEMHLYNDQSVMLWRELTLTIIYCPMYS